jgi:chemotaxis methyl-accepting protein methylase
MHHHFQGEKRSVTNAVDHHPREASVVPDRSAITAPAGSSLLRKCLGRCLFQMKRVWNHLPPSMCLQPTGQLYARSMHALVRLCAERKQYFATFFLRNRAELELMRRLVDRKPLNSAVHIAVLACSKGAEVYSIVWTIRSARPDLKIHLYAVDISQEIVDFARRGVYSRKGLDGMPLSEDEGTRIENVQWNTCRDQNAPIFERMNDQEFAAMFELQGDYAKIRPWLKQGITWLCADAGDQKLVTQIGPQDIVVANRFLCHMEPAAAESCLLRVARLVTPGGYLFVSGVDLDVRTRVVQKMGWKPVTEFIREIHEGDTSLSDGWPLEYWGLEPLRENRRDWEMRYASVFQMARQADPVDVRLHAFH